MPQRSPSTLAQIFNWLRSLVEPKKPEEPPKERVARSLVLSGKSANLVPFNLAQEIEDLNPWSLFVLRLTPLSYRDRSTIPIKSTKEFWYLFLHRIPPSQRKQESVSLVAAGKEFRMQRSQAGSEFGVYRLTVLHVPDKANESTWKPVFVESLKFADDAIARSFMIRLGTMLLVKKCEGVAWPKIVEEMLRRSKLGHNRNLWNEEQAADPYKARRDR